MSVTPSEIPGRFGIFGGRYVSETLLPSLDELDAAWTVARRDPAFTAEFERLLREYVGRPTPLGLARRLSDELGRGVRLYLKREDLCHTHCGGNVARERRPRTARARRVGLRRAT